MKSSSLIVLMFVCIWSLKMVQAGVAGEVSAEQVAETGATTVVDVAEPGAEMQADDEKEEPEKASGTGGEGEDGPASGGSAEDEPGDDIGGTLGGEQEETGEQGGSEPGSKDPTPADSALRLPEEEMGRISQAVATALKEQPKSSTPVEWGTLIVAGLSLLVAGLTFGLGVVKFVAVERKVGDSQTTLNNTLNDVQTKVRDSQDKLNDVETKVGESQESLNQIQTKLAEQERDYNATESIQLTGVLQTTAVARDGSKNRQVIVAGIRIENVRRKAFAIEGLRFHVSRQPMKDYLSKMWDASAEKMGLENERGELALGHVIAVGATGVSESPEFIEESSYGKLLVEHESANPVIGGGEFRVNMLRLFVLNAVAPQMLKVDIEVKVAEQDEPLLWSGLCGIGRMAEAPAAGEGSAVGRVLASKGFVGHQARGPGQVFE